MEKFQDHYSHITEILLSARLRPTRQRMFLCYFIFFKGYGHITAETLHRLAKGSNLKMSLATIYNTLHQLTLKGLLKEVSVESGKLYFDTNMSFHHHFVCEKTGKLTDIPQEDIVLEYVPVPPPGTRVQSINVVIRVCPDEKIADVA